jgi:hypothetical protein
MAIPVFDNIQIVDKDGFLTPEWRSILQDLLQVLQSRFSDEGLVMPSQTTAKISRLVSPPTQNGAMIYDSTDDLAKINIDGIWEVINTYPSPLTLPITIDEGGTGQVTQQDAINALVAAVTSGYFLRGNGTDATMSTIQIGDLPVLNPIQLSVNTAINGASLTIGVPYTYESIASDIITLSIAGGSTLRNPPVLNGSSTTAGFNPEDVFILTRYADNTILIT